jgi:phosphoribosylformimino-5-aminoimidazole carboxamide ribotide isomerase
MLIIPAIDLKGGKCVRLLQGRAEDETVYSEDPAETARLWAGMGAELIHIVDLDGAFSGAQGNLESIVAIRKAIEIPLEIGGGIRTMGTIDGLMRMGLDRVILGTIAATDPGFLKRACDKYPGRIIAGIDARDGKVAVKGWVEVTGIDALALASKMEECGAAGIIYTDISKDGMMAGPNVEATDKMVRRVSIPVIASGGISKIEDVKDLLQIKNLWGAITGKAIYSGTLKLPEAIRLTKEN